MHCNNCEETNIENFYKAFIKRNYYLCKKCSNNKSKEYYRTEDGLINAIHSSQKRKSKIKKWEEFLCTKKELSNWLINHTTFSELFEKWKLSGYDRNLRPSVDRIKREKSYELNNLQLLTWKDNDYKKRCDVSLTPQSNNKSGTTGVSWLTHRNKWMSRIMVSGEVIHLGVYKKLNDAIVARKTAENKYFGKVVTC